MSEHIRDFQCYRSRMRGIAYRMLGSRDDAEDIVQEAYLRWYRADRTQIASPEAWLVTTVSRLCIDRLRQARAQRETYVGPWLPEPLVGEAPPADAPTELASNLSVAFLVVLERLAPEERAAFLLREIFDIGYSEVAQILGKSEAACRQIVSRASKRVRENKPRLQVNEAAHRNLLERFVQAVLKHDKDALLGVLAEQATWTCDGGGKARTARKVVRGRDRVARFGLGVLGHNVEQIRMRMVTVNGELGVMVYDDERLSAVISIGTDGERILDIFSVLNPDKLRRVIEEAAIEPR